MPNNFVFSPDGRYLYGSSYYTGRLEHLPLRARDAETSTAVTNTDTGFFRPIPLGGDELIVFRYTGQRIRAGARSTRSPIDDISPITFLGERLAEEHPDRQDSGTSGRPPPIPFDTMPKPRARTGSPAGCSPNPSIRSCRATRTRLASGSAFNFSDPLQLNRAHASSRPTRPSGDLPSNERVHLDAEYERYDWRGAAELNNADFYDLFGPTKVGRKGYVVAVGPPQHADLRRAAAARSRRRAARSRATSIGCPSTRTSPST